MNKEQSLSQAVSLFILEVWGGSLSPERCWMQAFAYNEHMVQCDFPVLNNPGWIWPLTSGAGFMLTSSSPFTGLPLACFSTVSCLLWLPFLYSLWELNIVDRGLESRGCSGIHIQTEWHPHHLSCHDCDGTCWTASFNNCWLWKTTLEAVFTFTAGFNCLWFSQFLFGTP